MGKHGAISGGNHRFAGGLLLGALASGALAVASLSTAGAANATCVSFSGVNNRGGCTTTNLGDIAIGLGPRTIVTASGGFNTSIAVGRDAAADAEGGHGNLAVAVGKPGRNPGIVDRVLGNVDPSDNQPTVAGAFGGNLNRAVVFGRGSTAFAVGGTTFNDQDIPGGNSTAIAVGHGSNADAFGANRFAGALGPNRNAINGINNGDDS